MAVTGDGLNFSTTPAMGLFQPTPGVCGALGVEPAGKSWMELYNTALGLIDQHTHAPGFGTKVPSAGLNINADLAFGSFNVTGLRSARFVAQGSPLALVVDIGCLYVSGVDLYYNDMNGSQIRLTTGGGIVGTSGSISGLSAPASVTYLSASKLFSFFQNTNVYANVQTGPLSISDATVPNGKAATLFAPAGLAANYNLTLPTALPGSLSFVTMTSGGAIATFAGIAIAGSNLTLPGALTLGAGLIVAGTIGGVTDPSTAQQAATKNYVDTSNPPQAWTGLSYAAGWSGVNGAWLKDRNRVQLRGQVTYAGGGSSTIATLPAGSRPSIQLEFLCNALTNGGSNAVVGVLIVNTDGTIQFTLAVPPIAGVVQPLSVGDRIWLDAVSFNVT